MGTKSRWKYLAAKPKSNYLQLFVKDRWIAARTLFGQTLGEDARTPAQVASDFALPLEAVHEAIAYCETNPPEILEDWNREEAQMLTKESGRSNNRLLSISVPVAPTDHAEINSQ
jgi:hypothetical protein